MSGNARLLPEVEVVAARPLNAELPLRPSSPTSRVLRFPVIHVDRKERRLQVRARRQALALMVGSGLIMVLVLYGVFAVFQEMIAGLS